MVNVPHRSGDGRLALLLSLACLVPGASTPASAQSAENVAVVINDNSPASQQIGEYYARKRGLPASNVFRIRTSVDETVTPQVYVATIQQPIANALARGGLQDRILYIVLTKGIPLRVNGTTDINGTMASVDSELTLLYRRMTGQDTASRGRIDNPYYLGTREIAEARPFTHKEHDIYLVTRLDAFTVAEAMALVDKGMSPATDGRIVLDQQDRLVNTMGEDWLEQAASRLTAQGEADRVVLETTIKGARGITPVLGYYSWGSTDPRNRERKLGMGFAPGSLAATFVSTDGRTFREPPGNWVPNEDPNRATWFQGSPQSLIGDLIREGVTGVAGHVAEPFLQSAIRPDILFSSYVAGSNLVEAFYQAMPHLSWRTLVVGDPLCAPFRRQTLTRAEIEDGTDAATALPSLFGTRRLAQAVAEQPGVPARALALALRGEALAARGDRAGARTAFEEATDAAPQLGSAQLQLALMLDQAGQTDAAIERYRRVIESQPKNAIALNNLAYRLAVDKGSPKEALPLAQRAVALAAEDATVLDTLAWIEHLLGDDMGAVKRMAVALKYAPQNAEVRLHAAIIYAASGAKAVAADQLKEALRLNPALESHEDVKRLREQLK